MVPMLQCQDRLPEAEEARTLKDGEMRPEKTLLVAWGYHTIIQSIYFYGHFHFP